MENYKINLEEVFLNDIKNNSRPIITIGESETGKTFLMLKVLTHLINNNSFEEYHVVLPNFNQEQNNSYEFLINLKNVFIYTEYHNVIIEKLMNNNKKIFFCLDDGTGRLDRYNQETLKQLITCTRHKKISVWLIVHSSNGVITPQIRNNVKYLFLTNFENVYSLHDDIYKQYISALYGKNNFELFKKDFYDNTMHINEYGQILIARNMKHGEGKRVLMDLNVSKWNVLKEKLQIVKPVKHIIKTEPVKVKPFVSYRTRKY